MSSSLTRSKTSSDEVLDNTYHFRWASIRNLLYISFAYSSHPIHFDIFYSLYTYPTTIFNFVAGALIVGMTYMCVDLFIKQYTRRLDSDHNLSPVLKGITVSLMMQSALYSIMHVRHIGDGVRFLATSFSSKPVWAQCPKHLNGSECLDVEAVLQRCTKQGVKERIWINITSAHINYIIHFSNYDRGLLTWRIFVTAVIWILNFCVATIPDSIGAILKFNKYVLYWKVGSSVITYAFLAISTGRSKEAFLELMDINRNGSTVRALNDVALIYGIGMIGVYDFESSSTFTMVDNAVLIFTICFIVFAIVRSMISKILLLGVTDCLDVTAGNIKTWHYLVFALLPLGTEFLYGQKLITIYIYIHLSLTLIPYLMLYTLTMCRLLHSEFPSIKIIYIVGLLCLAGFCFSTPLLMSDENLHMMRRGISKGLYTSLFLFGGFRMTIIMWVYGVRKFATDIKFWLGFSPTKYWIVCWTFLPVLLLTAFAASVFVVFDLKDNIQVYVALGWIILSILIMLGLQIRTIVHYVMRNVRVFEVGVANLSFNVQIMLCLVYNFLFVKSVKKTDLMYCKHGEANNLIGAFRSNKKYGPHDPKDRQRRRRYNENVHHRQCFHECMTLDEEVDCNHLPLMNTGEGPSSEIDSESSLTKMYESAPTRTPSVVTVVEMNPDTKQKSA